MRPLFVCDADATNFICNKLFNFVVSIKSLAQTGSAFNLNCLRVVANLLHSFKEPTTFSISSKYVLLCSALCGHASIKLRLAAWSVLSGLAHSFDGANHLVKVLAKLPGGFHACCLSTFLDATETSAVRQMAGDVFLQLLTHNTPHRHIKPVSTASTLEPFDDLNKTIFEMLKCHQFYATMNLQLQHFWDNADDNNLDNSSRTLITCDVVRTFCAIITQLFDMSPEPILCELQSHDLLINIFRLTPVVIVTTNEASVRMLVEVCKVISRCLQRRNILLDAIALEEQAIIGALVSSLDPNMYGMTTLHFSNIRFILLKLYADSVSPPLRMNALIGLLTVVTQITQRIKIVACYELDGKERIKCLQNLIQFSLQPNQNQGNL